MAWLLQVVATLSYRMEQECAVMRHTSESFVRHTSEAVVRHTSESFVRNTPETIVRQRA